MEDRQRNRGTDAVGLAAGGKESARRDVRSPADRAEKVELRQKVLFGGLLPRHLGGEAALGREDVRPAPEQVRRNSDERGRVELRHGLVAEHLPETPRNAADEDRHPVHRLLQARAQRRDRRTRLLHRVLRLAQRELVLEARIVLRLEQPERRELERQVALGDLETPLERPERQVVQRDLGRKLHPRRVQRAELRLEVRRARLDLLRLAAE